MAVTRAERISWLGLLGFSSPVLVSQAIDLATRSYMPSFLTATLGLPIVAVGILLMTARLISSVIDIAVGWASDRFPTRIGLRRPWMMAGVPVIVLAATGLFWAEPGVGLAMVGGWLLLLHFGHSLIGTPLGGWALELSSDPNERVRIMGAKIWLACAGSLATLTLPNLLAQGLATNRAEQMHLLGTVIIITAPVTVFFAVRSVRELQAAAISQAAHSMFAPGSPLGVFISMVRDREMRSILVLYALVGVADAATTSTFLFFVDDALGLPGYGSALLLVPVIVPLVGLPVWTHVSRLLGKRETLRIAFVWQILVAPVAFILPSGALLPLILWLLVRNATTGVDYTLVRAMMADATRQETERGVRSGASRHALFNLARRITFAIGVGVSLSILGVGGFEVGDLNKEGALTLLRIVHVVPVVAAALLALVLLRKKKVVLLHPREHLIPNC